MVYSQTSEGKGEENWGRGDFSKSFFSVVLKWFWSVSYFQDFQLFLNARFGCFDVQA